MSARFFQSAKLVPLILLSLASAAMSGCLYEGVSSLNEFTLCGTVLKSGQPFGSRWATFDLHYWDGQEVKSKSREVYLDAKGKACADFRFSEGKDNMNDHYPEKVRVHVSGGSTLGEVISHHFDNKDDAEHVTVQVLFDFDAPQEPLAENVGLYLLKHATSGGKRKVKPEASVTARAEKPASSERTEIPAEKREGAPANIAL